MTERLYYYDPGLHAFDAQVLSAEVRGGRVAVTLDRTAFYPTGGGQLHDTGTLGGAPVLEVADENGQIVHYLAREPLGARAHGEIDWARRRDLTEQHTGQHILSQALVQLYGADTISVHMTESNCTLDLRRPLTPDEHTQAEELANEIVRSNRPVRALFVSDDELRQMPLRKLPASKYDKIRIVEIADFDWSPCGGTHVRATGEVGLIKIVRAERRGSEQRVEFACGRRALHDYRWKNQVVVSIAAQLTVKDTELASAVQRMDDENRDMRRLISGLKSERLDYEAQALWASAPYDGRARRVEHVFSGRPPEEVRQLAIRLKDRPQTILLFAVSGDKSHIIFARSADVAVDMGRAVREVSALFGGRGGGQPEIAQGGVVAGSDLREVLTAAREKIQ
ncbi:MAG: hypothetical protein HY259_03025 [Chloroflexi bacterium]|nr:hypothetical protein [Chloroflexota bacterium]MBI3732415.1 hypothetical protein [Chloroflexota bacterium]